MTLRETLVGQIESHILQAETLQNEYKGQDMPQDVADKITGHLNDIKGLRERLDQADQLSDAKNYMGESRGVAATHMAWQEAQPDEGIVPVDAKSYREIEIKALDGRPLTIRYNVPLGVQKPEYKYAFESYMRNGERRMGGRDAKALQEGVDSAGGYLVPEDMQMQIIKKVATMVVFRQFARVVQTSRDSVKWPKIQYTTDDNYTSGVRLTWTGEVPASSTVHAATDPVFGEINIPVNTAMASLAVYNDMLEDSAFDVEGILGDLFGEAFALGEESAFWIGTGAGQPLGITANVDATDGVASVVSGHATLLTNNGLLDLVYALPSQYENGARLFMRKATELAVRKLLNAGSTDYAWPVVNQVGSFGPVEPMLLGYPLSRQEFVPAIAGNAFPIVFGQLSGYAVVDRVGLSIQRLDELSAKSNQKEFLARKRVGGQVIEPWRLRVQKIST